MASEINGMSAMDNEFVIKVGKYNNGIAYPVNSPYCLVASFVAYPAIAKRCATIISSKKLAKELIKLLPVFGSAIDIICLRVVVLFFRNEKNFFRTGTIFLRLKM